jgi:ribosomal protein L28
VVQHNKDQIYFCWKRWAKPHAARTDHRARSTNNGEHSRTHRKPTVSLAAKKPSIGCKTQPDRTETTPRSKRKDRRRWKPQTDERWRLTDDPSWVKRWCCRRSTRTIVNGRISTSEKKRLDLQGEQGKEEGGESSRERGERSVF